MLLFLTQLFACDYTQGLYNVSLGSSGDFLLSNLNNSDPAMIKTAMNWTQMNSSIVFVRNRNGFTIMLGSKKLCLMGADQVMLCNPYDRSVLDDWRFVETSKGTSIRTRNMCLTVSMTPRSFMSHPFFSLRTTPCGSKVYSYFSIDRIDPYAFNPHGGFSSYGSGFN